MAHKYNTKEKQMASSGIVYCKFVEAVNFNLGSENPCVCIDCFVHLYHVWMYPFIFGYSLGRDILFFETLNQAKQDRTRHTSKIYEIETANGHVVKIVREHFVQRFLSEVITINEKMYYNPQQASSVADWTASNVDQKSYTQFQIDEIDKQFQKSNVHKNIQQEYVWDGTKFVLEKETIY